MVSTGISNNFSNAATPPYSYGNNPNEKLNDNSQKTDESKPSKTDTNNSQGSLTDEELKEIDSLKKRDAEVKAHEQAHVAVGGQYAGSASFEYQTGPDGVRYAVGGEVPIDVSEIQDDPEATVTKMGIVQKAALAPVSPSAADRAIASTASMKEMEARSEIANDSLATQEKTKAGISERQNYADQSEKGATLNIKI